MHVLIVKHAALGDVVRTSYFAKPLKLKFGTALRLSWITASAAEPLIRFNSAIDDIWLGFEEAKQYEFDLVYSLDDEISVLEEVARLGARSLIGAYLNADGKPSYTDNSAEWFDMGLLSKFGKKRADELKKFNKNGHSKIFSRIFDVPSAIPQYYGDPELEEWGHRWIGKARPAIGINPFAGGRWPSKQLPINELRVLLSLLLDAQCPLGGNSQIVLLGAGEDRLKNASLVSQFSTSRLRAADTDESPLRLAALIKSLDYLITSDSLPMHLAIAQGVKTLAFFAPTSAAEIDDFGLVRKVISDSHDYCSYKPYADNKDITAARLFESIHLQ